jgi:hypothetical protein
MSTPSLEKVAKTVVEPKNAKIFTPKVNFKLQNINNMNKKTLPKLGSITHQMSGPFLGLSHRHLSNIEYRQPCLFACIAAPLDQVYI